MVRTEPARIAICGGGIGGLAFALILKKYVGSKELLVDLYESGPKFTEIGAGITAWRRTRSIFEAIGMGEALEKKAVVPTMTFRKSDTQEPFPWHELAIPYGVALPRVEMLKLLLEHLAPYDTPWLSTHFSKRLVSYQQDASGVTLHFADGSIGRADILIGADGVGSAVRRQMYTDLAEAARPTDPQKAEELLRYIPPSWSGTYAYRTLLDSRKLAAVSPDNVMLKGGAAWCGVDKHVISYYISPTILNILLFYTVPNSLGKPLEGPSVTYAEQEEIMELYKDWEPDLRAVTGIVGETSKWAISQVRGLPHYVDRRVALLGDSAHAMTTHFGAGSGQAVEDAYILGRLLAHPSVDASNLADALRVYDAVRRPIGNEVVERSLRLGFLYELHPDFLPPGTDVDSVRAGDRAQFERIAEDMEDIWGFHSGGLPEDDWRRAQELLRTA